MSDDRSNNFDFLRLMGAFLVLVHHSFILSGSGQDPLGRITQTTTFGAVGVLIFFIISGYLITKSWVEHPNCIRFLKNRILRIIPGLAVLIILSTFVIGPIVSIYSFNVYFSHIDMIISYLKCILLDINFHLPGVFVNNIGDAGVNGSLWTLPVEFTMYMVILCLGFIGLNNRKWLLVIFTLICIVLFVNTNYEIHFILISDIVETLGLKDLLSGILINGDITITFLIGGLIYLYKDRVIYNRYLFFILSFIWIISLTTNYVKLTTFLCLPYIVIYVAFIPSKVLSKVSQYGDFSYGLYIYGFIVQQTILHYIPQLNFRPYLFLIITLPITLCCAYLSWHLIESKALKLKNITSLRDVKWKMENSKAGL